MKRWVSLILLLVLVSTVSFSFVSANIFSDFWGKITGKATAICGNGVVEGEEFCDENDFGGFSCSSFGLGEGSLTCTSDCNIDTSGCGGGTSNASGAASTSATSTLEIVSDSSTLANGQPSVPAFTISTWTADIPGAIWIWSEEKVSDPVNDTYVTFIRNFNAPITTDNATITIAADNSYECYINGELVGADNAEYNFRAGDEDTYTIQDILNLGFGQNNDLTCTVKNWAQPGGTYISNAAGLLYKITLPYEAPTYAGTCSELVNEVVYAQDFEQGGIQYYSEWNGAYESDWYFNGSNRHFTDYYASWGFNYQDEGKQQYGFIEKGAMVFDDESFDAAGILKNMVGQNFCQVHQYNDDIVYVCNWNAYNQGVNIDPSTWTSREILWNHDNVIVRLSIGFGKELSDAEINAIVEKKTAEFINSLKDNQGKWLGWENFDVDWPFSNLVFDSLEACSSQVPPVACNPAWACITEPAICPEYGFQTQTCKDYCEENKVITTQISCNPGICSGCLVPKWFGSESLGYNRCIPYGFRFENQIGWSFENQTGSWSETLRVGDAMGYSDINFSIAEDGLVSLSVDGWGDNPYTFRQGDRVDVDVSEWGGSTASFSFVATKVVYDAENYEDSYVTFDFTTIYLGQVADAIDSYCDIDGSVKPQKARIGKNDEPAECQNNYECASNQCSNGECIDLSEQIRSESGFFRALGCRILNIVSLGAVDYDQCLAGSTQ